MLLNLSGEAIIGTVFGEEMKWMIRLNGKTILDALATAFDD